MQTNHSVINDFDNYERIRRQFSFWLMWVSANAIGIACGWAIGETLGQIIGQKFGWTLGVRVAWVLFEAILWLARGIVLFYVREFSAWRKLDTIIWAGSEFFGEILGEGMLEVNGPIWLTFGAMWGALLGAGMWLMFWFVVQPKRTMKWHPLIAAIWIFIALVGGSFLFGLGIAFGQELGGFVGRALHPILGWAVSGAVVGCLVGGITGLAFVRLLKWQLPINT